MAEALLAAAKAAGFDLVVVDTLRTAEEQAEYLRTGASKRKDSLHLHGLAIDVAPRPLMKLKNWAPEHPEWFRLGELGEGLGLRWGGRWKSPVDRPHFECPLVMEKRILRSGAK